MKYAFYSVICFLIFYCSAFGQDCKYSINKTDALTGEKMLKAKIRINMHSEMDFAKTGEEIRVEFFISVAGEKNFIMPAGSLIDLKLGNDQVITLASVKDASPSTYLSTTSNSAIIYSIYGMSYAVERTQAAEIIRYGVKYSRTHLEGDTYFEHTYKEKETDKTKIAANCVFNEGKGMAHAAVSVASTRPAPHADEDNEESLIEAAMRKKKEKKEREEAENKAANNPTPIKPMAKETVKLSTSASPAETKSASPAKNPSANATQAPAPVQVVPLSGADELMKWKKLLDQGIITKEEFEVQKKKILGN